MAILPAMGVGYFLIYWVIGLFLNFDFSSGQSFLKMLIFYGFAGSADGFGIVLIAYAIAPSRKMRVSKSIAAVAFWSSTCLLIFVIACAIVGFLKFHRLPPLTIVMQSWWGLYDLFFINLGIAFGKRWLIKIDKEDLNSLSTSSIAGATKAEKKP